MLTQLDSKVCGRRCFSMSRVTTSQAKIKASTIELDSWAAFFVAVVHLSTLIIPASFLHPEMEEVHRSKVNYSDNNSSRRTCAHNHTCTRARTHTHKLTQSYF